MQSNDYLTGASGGRAIRATLGAVLERHGFRRASGMLYVKPREDGVLVLADLQRSGQWSHPGVASGILLDLGLGVAPTRDMRSAAMRSLACILGSGPAVATMCRVNNEVVAGWRLLGGEPRRVAGLLDWTVRDDWRNAPEAMWYRGTTDLERWAAFLNDVLPTALDRLARSTLDQRGLAAGLRLAD